VRRLLHLALQYARFGAVGLAATATHAVMFTGLIEFAGLAPLVANFAAFGTAVLVSFFGHFHWTFRSQTGAHGWQQQRAAFMRFAQVALAGLALNSLAVLLVVNLLALPYPYALILMVTVVPLVVFAMSKFWVFA
jgi:putative flippase GtrA